MTDRLKKAVPPRYFDAWMISTANGHLCPQFGVETTRTLLRMAYRDKNNHMPELVGFRCVRVRIAKRIRVKR